jgi:hypothetical protein
LTQKICWKISIAELWKVGFISPKKENRIIKNVLLAF